MQRHVSSDVCRSRENQERLDILNACSLTRLHNALAHDDSYLVYEVATIFRTPHIVRYNEKK